MPQTKSKQNKIRLNEKIGYTAMLLNVLSMYLIIFTSRFEFLFIQLIFLFIQFIFLSYWGLTTFNEKYEIKTK